MRTHKETDAYSDQNKRKSRIEISNSMIDSANVIALPSVYRNLLTNVLETMIITVYCKKSASCVAIKK